jgi:hypothetical protein
MDQPLKYKDRPETRHIEKRCQQRGVRKIDLQTLYAVADQLAPVGAGRWAMTVSREAAAELRAEGYNAGGIDRLSRRALIVDASDAPITILIPHRRRGRHYRRVANGRRSSWGRGRH